MAILSFDDEPKRMKLVSLHPDVNPDEVNTNTQFECIIMIIPSHAPTTKPPTVDLRRLIRNVIDTSGFYTSWKKTKLAWWGKE